MAVAGAGAIATEAIANRPRKVKLRSRKTSEKPVVTSMVVIFGINGLKHAVVDKSLPPTSYWIRMAFLGLGLATINEINAKLGKSFAYMVMTAVVFSQSKGILENLQGIEKKEKQSASFTPGEVPTTLAAMRTTDRQPFTLFFERGNLQQPDSPPITRHTPFIDPQRGRRRPAPIPYSGSTIA